MSHDFHPPSCASLANPCLCIGLPHLWDSPHANFLPPENSNGSFQWKKKGFYFFVHEDEVQNGQVYKTCDVFKQLAEIRLFIMFSGTLNWRCGSLTQQVGNEAGINKAGFQCWGGGGGGRSHFWKHNGLQRRRKTIFSADNLLCNGWDRKSWGCQAAFAILIPGLSTKEISPLGKHHCASPGCSSVSSHLHHALLSRPTCKKVRNQWNTAWELESTWATPGTSAKICWRTQSLDCRHVWVGIQTAEASIVAPTNWAPSGAPVQTTSFPWDLSCMPLLASTTLPWAGSYLLLMEKQNSLSETSSTWETCLPPVTTENT